MASVQFTWSDMWLQWYAEQVNDEVKNEFLKQVELVELVKRISPKVQLEILEFAPVEVKRLVADSIHKQYYEKIMWNVEEVEEEEEECSLDELKAIARRYKEETDRILNYEGRLADD